MPSYRMGRALVLIRPILLREGVFEHRSLARLLAQWFSASRPHWSVPPQAGLHTQVLEARVPR
ncbi:MAG: hypothetical protein AVDCRST_MAG51-2477 [uncultured Ramlibacter sp.]|uniref:Uncharacterized protein n=1 Tax=uncultured Ramlibacter sp. TaxID=260755 RepID=A0A6J4PZ33_9BURK|nr:MAG: hypothetical protein AVDCRST_MAG51-2477 [uncultured Ramlibacter sp.]